MPLNFGLLQPVDIGARFTAGQESVQRNQLAQQQRQQDQDMNALRMQQLSGAVSQQERQVKAETATQKTAMFRNRLQRARDPNAVRELVKMQYADPDLGPILSQTGTLEQALAEVPDDPAQFELHRQQEIMGMSEWMKSQLPKVVGNAVFNPATNTFFTPPDRPVVPKEFTPPASVLEFERAQKDPEYLNFLRDRAAAIRAPVPVKATGGGGAAPKPLTEPQAIKLRENVAKDYKAATTTLSQMDDLLDSIEAVKTAPGLAAATGYTGKYLPSFSEGKAAQAETRIANLKGKVTALGKATAAMSGSIGSIANQEWKILSDQIAALDEVKGAGPLLEQIALVEQRAINARELIRDAYEKTRSEDFERFPQFRDLPANRSRVNPDVATNAVPPRAANQISGQNLAPAATGTSVTLPDGRVKTFPTAEAANQFKKAAGIK
jgi:hypothetical protein